MIIDIRARKSGKTADLIKRCAENGGYIVTHSYESAHQIRKTAIDMGLQIPLPFTFSEFVKLEYYGPGVKVVYIDNLDLCLESITKVPIDTVTLTKETK